jgi:hypothetical protein
MSMGPVIQKKLFGADKSGSLAVVEVSGGGLGLGGRVDLLSLYNV